MEEAPNLPEVSADTRANFAQDLVAGFEKKKAKFEQKEAWK
jgi:hypothetical protein